MQIISQEAKSVYCGNASIHTIGWRITMNNIEDIFRNMDRQITLLGNNLLNIDESKLDEKAIDLLYTLRKKLASFIDEYSDIKNIASYRGKSIDTDEIKFDINMMVNLAGSRKVRRLEEQINNIANLSEEFKEHIKNLE